MKRFLLPLYFLLIPGFLHAQCVLLPNAVADLTLVHQNTNCFNNSGVAYNPIQNVYYGVRAGNTGFPLETWSATGVPLFQTTAGFDWRGMWWNPVTNQLEGNGYNTFGVWTANLNASGHALNTGSTIFTGYNQPDPQSCGDLDPSAYEILYYNNGSVHRYSRTNNAFLGSYPLTGTPVALANLNWTTLMYTGCPGKEIALLDFNNKVVYVYDKATGAYTGSSVLPASAITTSSFRTSWANCRVWLFNLSNFTWHSYKIFDQCASCSAVFTNINASICPGDSVFAAGAWQTNAGVYYDSLQSAANCDSIVVTTVSLTPAIITNQNHSICAGDSLFLAGAWQTNAGVYTDSLQSVSGCDSIVNHNLTVTPPIIQNINHTLCNGDSILIGTNWQFNSGIYTDSLQSAAGCDSIIQHNVTVLAAISGSHNVTLCSGDSLFVGGAWQTTSGVYSTLYSAANGCDSIHNTNLNITPPTYNSSVQTICFGDSIFLAGAWRKTPGAYNDTLSTPFGCDSIVSTILLVDASLFAYLGKDTSLCVGQSITLQPTNTASSYTWQDNSTSPSFTATQTGLYWVEVQSGACKDRDSIWVYFNPSPQFSLGPDQSLCPGQTITLEANVPGALYDWFNHDKNSWYTVTKDGTYWVTVSINNCKSSDTVNIDFNNPSCVCDLFVPNAFSPNGDNLNDELKVIRDEGIILLDFKIYNRYGNQVFRLDGLNTSWNGLHDGTPADLGTYYYFLKYKCTYTGKEQVIKGDILLMR